MLRSLHVRNLAIIDELSLDWSSGFSVLTGETGAGKSILLDALGLALGLRADPGLVRAGADKAEVAAEFSLEDCAEASAWLAERELLDGNECTIRRVVAAEGRTRAFVNGSPVNAGDLRELGECLVEVFGQGDSRLLLQADAQRLLLDEAAQHPDALTAVRVVAGEVQGIEREQAALRAAQSRDPAQLDYLRFQLQELEALDLGVQELDALDAEQRRLANAGRLIADGEAAQQTLYGADGSVYDQLSAVLGGLRSLLPLHDGFSEIETLAAGAQAQAREAADALRRLLERMDLDPERLAAVEQRLSAIHDLARKHRVRADELVARVQTLKNEVAALEDADGALARLEQARQRALAAYRVAAEALSASRRAAAEQLAQAVTARVRELGMPDAQFRVGVEPAGRDKPSTQGDDLVRFDFSANPGQPPRPLAKVASGGELSRVALAIQVSLRSTSGAATMIFDEVDAGIGGATAEIVGRQLAELGDRRQVLCVTHLAQVAARAGRHYGIAKAVSAGQTRTQVRELDRSGRVAEIARMLGNADAATTTALARDLLKRAG